MRKLTPERLRDRSGVALAFVALLLFVFLGLVALAVDLGMLLGARTEAQRTADAAALAGASSLLDSPTDFALAESTARDWGGRNLVRGISPVILPEDVVIDRSDARVTVRVEFSDGHPANAPVPNVFARAIGFPTSNISAIAAARASVASGVECILPFALMDRWWSRTANPNRLATWEDAWDDDDIYRPGPLDPADMGAPPRQTGYGVSDRGSFLRIYAPSPQESPRPGWWFPIRGAGQGVPVLQARIRGCVDNDVTSLDSTIRIEPGEMGNPIYTAFNDLVDMDPNLRWVESGPGVPLGGCAKRLGQESEGCVTNSPRIRPMPLIAPPEAPLSGGENFITVRNFVGVFVVCAGVLNGDGQTCSGGSGGNNPDSGIWVRFVDYRGVNPRPPEEADPGSLIRVLELVR